MGYSGHPRKTAQEEIEDTRKENLRIEELRSSQGVGGGGIDPASFFFLIGCMLTFYVVVRSLAMLPEWGRDLVFLVVIVVVLLMLWRASKQFAKSFRARPIQTTVYAVLNLLVFAAIGWELNSFFHAFGSHPASYFASEGYSPNILRTEKKGEILYQLFAYPEVWSDPIIVPRACKHADFMSPNQVRIKVNGTVMPGADYRPMPGDTLSFMGIASRPVAATVRIFMRTPTIAELKQPIPFEPLPSAKEQR